MHTRLFPVSNTSYSERHSAALIICCWRSGKHYASRQFVAHRGWRQRYPENTLLALREAVSAGAVNIELDVQLSADGEAFIFHDPTLSRLCNQEGLIWDYRQTPSPRFPPMNPAALGNSFWYTTQPASRVALLLQGHPSVDAYVELKGESLMQFGCAPMLDATFRALTGIEERCVLISFELEALLEAKARGWQRCGAVFDYWPDWQLASLAELAPEVVFIDRHCIPVEADLRQLPFPLVVYEVGSLLEAKDWLARGAAGIETFLIGELLEEAKLV